MKHLSVIVWREHFARLEECAQDFITDWHYGFQASPRSGIDILFPSGDLDPQQLIFTNKGIELARADIDFLVFTISVVLESLYARGGCHWRQLLSDAGDVFRASIAGPLSAVPSGAKWDP